MVDSLAARDVLHRQLTGVMIALHMAVALLYLFARAAFSAPVRDMPALQPILGQHPFWGLVHAAIAALLIAGLVTVRPPLPSIACHASAACWLVWGLLLLVWGALATASVSLVGPILALVGGVPLSWLCARAWTTREH
ncbi:hypothetical protein DT076_16545 [Desertihabitans brevis]|uniref:Uncharacterized protein n=1 Tax=Desertihabitans brevis TaxID=2268447 RepID=A0A367YR92_9ACTN|nr:hypothetical protein [Desertihabitans brevis]RCK68257.1 hypothetical protein DT076_16545 [Desertihabitans brevis]